MIRNYVKLGYIISLQHFTKNSSQLSDETKRLIDSLHKKLINFQLTNSIIFDQMRIVTLAPIELKNFSSKPYIFLPSTQ